MFEPGGRIALAGILAAFTLSRTAVAHHLRVPRDAAVLDCKKEGKEFWYWPDRVATRAGLAAALELESLGEA